MKNKLTKIFFNEISYTIEIFVLLYIFFDAVSILLLRYTEGYFPIERIKLMSVVLFILFCLWGISYLLVRFYQIYFFVGYRIF